MRKRPSSSNNGGYNQSGQQNHQNRKPRYGHSQGGDRSGGGRPRKNYGQLREKYLAQARDALAYGDRVLAENFFQHADHCYRMMMEEGYRPRQHNAPVEQGDAPQEAVPQEVHVEESAPSALPAFLTAQYEPSAPAEPVVAQDWEERDA